VSDYFAYSDSLTAGELARAEDVASELEAIEAGLDLLPKPRNDGTGFEDPFVVAEATQDDHAANWGQLKTLETNAADSAQLAQSEASDSENSAAAALTSENNSADHESACATSETNSADHESKAQEWADNNRNAVITGETNKFSARHWAEVAQETVQGARVYKGVHDASTSTYPTDTPGVGHYWIIVVAGTIGGTAYGINDEIIYNGSSWARVPNNNAVNSVNGQTDIVVLDYNDVGAASAGHGHSNATVAADGFMSLSDKTKLDGVESGATGDLSASEILTLLKTVDGAGSGLDADKIDGYTSSSLQKVSDSIDSSRIINVPSTWTIDTNTWRPASDSVTSTSSSTSASSKAAKTAYDRGSAGVSAAAAAQATADSKLSSVPTNLGGVGTYAYLATSSNNTAIIQGATYAGSSLDYAGNTNGIVQKTTSSPTGTWRAMGYCPAVSIYPSSTLFVRIS